MPLYHSSASILSLCANLHAGSAQALGRKFSTARFWEECRASNATAIQYVGETLRYLLAAPPQYDAVSGECLDRKHSVRIAFGNGLRPDIWDRFKDRFGVAAIAEFYSATESPGGTWNLSKNDFSRGAIGRSGWLYALLVGSSTAIVDVDWNTDAPWRDPKTNFCRRVKPGEPGELLYRLPAEDINQRFQGYFNNSGATNSKILRGVFAPGDAWFRSGDVLRQDAGLTFFSDRIGDTFRWKSENVSTTEVSQAVGLHPAVREANVYGVQVPNHDGRAGCVAICFDQPTPDEATLRSLAVHVRSSLPRYARPLFLRLVRDVGVGSQTTGTNKQQKQNLRKVGVRPRMKRKAETDDGSGEAATEEDDADIYWLRGNSYVPFGEKEWRELEGGRVKL